MMKIDTERELGRIFHSAEGPHIVGQSNIAITFFLPAARDRLVDKNVIHTGETPHKAQDLANCLSRLMSSKDHVGHDDRTRIYEWVTWHAALALQLNNGIERGS